MRRKQILSMPFKVPAKKGEKQVTVQRDEKYLILDLWEKNKIRCRHAMETATGEYETWYPDSGIWKQENLNNASGMESWYWGRKMDEKDWRLSTEDKRLIEEATQDYGWVTDAFSRIARMEEEYSREVRETKRERKEARIARLMGSIPGPGQEVREWIIKKLAGDLQYAFYDKERKLYHCTACRGDFTEKAAGGKLRDKDGISCPLCGHPVTVRKRTKSAEIKGRLTLIHNVDEKQGVQRHFLVTVAWNRERTVSLKEIIRMFLLRNRKHALKIYYADGWCGRWTEGNRANRRWGTGYLYPDPEGIRAGLQGTEYAVWSEVLPMLAEAGAEAEYNNLLVESNRYMARTVEYLLKGRFYRLLKEESERISRNYGYWDDSLCLSGSSIEKVMKIRDRQLIHRLRQENGGIAMLSWLQWSDRTGRKISGECLKWYEENGIWEGTYQGSRASKHLSPEQLMHYLTRQKAESYPRRKAAAVLEQYEDYLSMAERLGKHMEDEMVYRPRELKRRHDEAAMELTLRQNRETAERQARQMRQKYPGYEEILQEIREKYAFENEEYRIVVPKDFGEITTEGIALHHCVGSTERYFDRIVSRETYICFLRRKEQPEMPFYTIEVEPGGTIRQHRGAFDEEPDIEKVKPFLRLWQKEIRKRMTEADHDYARKSEILRQKNMEELKEKKNTRVLEGLMEDLMEVI